MESLLVRDGPEVFEPRFQFARRPAGRGAHLDGFVPQRRPAFRRQPRPGEPVGQMAKREEMDVGVRQAALGQRPAQVEPEHRVRHEDRERPEPVAGRRRAPQFPDLREERGFERREQSLDQRAAGRFHRGSNLHGKCKV